MDVEKITMSGANVEQYNSSVQDAPEHLITPRLDLGDAVVKPLHLVTLEALYGTPGKLYWACLVKLFSDQLF
jgi:hypothetical protein